MSETGQSRSCPRCGAALAPAALNGLCPRCLLAMNLGVPTETAAGAAGPGGTVPNTAPPAPVPSLEEMARLFPHLELIETLGRGGMGVVYKARQPKLDRFVALKILLRRQEGATTAAAFAERFAREARALARLNHPAIVAVYDYGEAGGYPYLLMEHVDGVTLRQLLHGAKLDPEQALAIVPKICEALGFAHGQGVVHRDIKPENILLDKQGRVKIADFGIAKILAPGAQDLSLTGGKDVVGTPHYMAPEQLEQPAKVDHRADIFSLGVVFYEMLTGELPLGRFPPPSKKVQVDVRLDEVVLHALEKEPERRYQQATQVKTDLETIATSPPGPAPPTLRSTLAARPATSNHERLFQILGFTILAMLLAFAGWQLSRRFAVPRKTPALPAGSSAGPVSAESGTIASGSQDAYVQSEEMELQPDGSARFRNTIEKLNDSSQTWEQYGFVNSDFVDVTNMMDATRHRLVWETEHDNGAFRYSISLAEPVPPGARLCLLTEGTSTGQVQPTGAPGVFEYSMRHWPMVNQRTRRRELHRLPPGAKLLEKEPGDLQERIRDGRIELLIDRVIPPGDSLEIIYRYRLEAPAQAKDRS